MCGIAGLLDRSGAMPDRDVLKRMRDVMITRGPDDAGLYIAPGIGLAHRRLSIMDTSPAGHQPMANEDESVWAVFNGEIYNFKELRQDLEIGGHVFRSHTDTEVLVHGYEEWGSEGLVRRAHGMFAFALWDAQRQRLVLARDRVGKKPLFYAEIGKRLYFSSDIKSIWLAEDRLTVDPRGMDDFLFNYFINQGRTIYREVRKVPPATVIEVDGNGAHGTCYWRIDFTEKDECDEEEWLRRSEAVLRRAVERRMVADVPLGAFLSGGVDSSLVVAFMSHASTKPVKTFSIGSTDVKYNEFDYSRQVAARYRTDHQEYVVEPRAWEMLPQLVWHYGEPFGDSSAMPSFFLSRAARQVVTVALSGDGADETFAGYASYAAIHRSERCWWVPGWFRSQVLARAGDFLYGRWPEWTVAARLRALANNFSGDLRHAIRRDLGWGEPYRLDLYSDDMQAQLDGWHPTEAQVSDLGKHRFDRYADGWRAAIIATLLPSDYLVKLDVASMMNSLEVRCPFLDTELLELTARMRIERLLGPENRPKRMLKRLALKYLPADVVLRPKRGFEVPVREWLQGPWSKAVRRILLSDRAMRRGYFRRDTIDRVLRRHERGIDHRHRIWSLLWLEIWHLLFVDKVLKPTDNLPLE
jgi:asparagine synthase (glutamine-hydrolysing)